jgi:hypothetical protein
MISARSKIPSTAWPDAAISHGGASLFIILAAFCFFTSVLAPPALAAEGRMINVPSREGVAVPTFWVPQASAPATLVLLSGGAGTIGRLNASGWPASGNFLIRSGKLFAAHGFNLAMVAKPSDLEGLDPHLRISEKHLEDMHKVLLFLKRQSAAPIWLVATSQSSISAAAVAIAERESGLVDGVVLTSSITSYKIPNAVPKLDLDRIRVPVLVMHHENDACFACRAYEASHIYDGLKHAPVKKLLLVSGGGEPRGDPCEPYHHHGYIGMEQEAVDAIAAWIRAPAN